MEDFELSYEDYYKILSCIKQFIQQQKPQIPPLSYGPYVITVWYSDEANKYLKSNTKPGEFCICIKNPNGYNNMENRQKIKSIWDANLIPVEIIKDSQGLFFAFANFCLRDENIHKLNLICAENSIPTIEDFL